MDAVRAIAIMLVVFAHGVLLAAPAISFQLRSQLLYLGGYFGVELFFALSGLLIVGGLLRRLDKRPTLTRGDMLAFWQRRWWRTLPNYFVFLLLNATLFAAWFNAPAPDASYAVFAQNFAWPHPRAMPEAWSLAVEEWFYLLLPLLLAASLLIRPVPCRAVPLLLACWIVAATVARFTVAGWAEPSWDSGLRKIVLLRLDAIAWGGLVACWLHYCRARARRTAARALDFGLCVLAGCALWLSVGVSQGFQPVLAWAGLFTATGAGIALCLPAAALWQPGRLGAWIIRPVTWLSRISYSLYLVHFSFALPLMQRESLAAAMPLVWRLAGYAAVSLLGAWAAYRLVERPTLALRDRILTSPRRTAGGA
ncbi:acyltransferase [Halomonas cibimaris]|uniref:Acyltransferase n=1 Tax=Halomonas cibimaris TaxID=657012 RepID=A0ABP7L8S4_9GAMM